MHVDARRFLSKFCPDNELPMGRTDLSHVPLVTLRDIFHPPPDDPLMYNSYKVGPEQAASLRPYISGPLDVVRFEYYLEAESVD